MTQNRPSPTHKDSWTVHQTDLVGESVAKEFFTTVAGWLARDLERTIAGNVAEILEA